MTELYIDHEKPGAICVCDNCGHECRASSLKLICDAQERLTPGGEVPAGECPKCGALSYLNKKPEWSAGAKVKRLEAELAKLKAAAAPTVLIVVEGGVIQDVIADKPAAVGRVLVIDYDTEGADAGDVVEVIQSGGDTSEALVSVYPVGKPEIDLAQFAKIAA